jgi:hypothetical protein
MLIFDVCLIFVLQIGVTSTPVEVASFLRYDEFADVPER